MISSNIIFIISYLSCIFMTGLIWFVQIVHYPMFANVPEDSISNYAIIHANRTSFVVIFPMLLEITTAILLIWHRPDWLSNFNAAISLALVVIIFASTFFLQVPYHNQIQSSGEIQAINNLVLTNWIRTIAWSTRAIFLTFFLTQRL